MAHSTSSLGFLLILVALMASLRCAFGSIVCEDLPRDVCAFSVSSAGKRCVLEKFVLGNGEVKYQCRSSGVLVEKIIEWIETDQCVRLCGVDRDSVGISSDSLLESRFTAKLCSPGCYHNCPNIVDLYFNLAAGEDTRVSAVSLRRLVPLFTWEYSWFLRSDDCTADPAKRGRLCTMSS